MPRSILRIRMYFFDTMLDMHQPANGKPVFCSFLCPRDITHVTIRKNTKATITCVKKKDDKRQASVCAHMLLKYEGKISDRNSQN